MTALDKDGKPMVCPHGQLTRQCDSHVTPLYAAPQPVASPDDTTSRVPSGPAVAAPVNEAGEQYEGEIEDREARDIILLALTALRECADQAEVVKIAERYCKAWLDAHPERLADAGKPIAYGSLTTHLT